MASQTRQYRTQAIKDAVAKLAAGDFVLITAFPNSATTWGPRPGIVLERYSNDFFLVCPITHTKGMGGVAVGPRYPGIERQNLYRETYVQCDEGALDYYPSYINLMASMTLGGLSPSPYGKKNWIMPLCNEVGGGTYCHSELHTAYLQKLFCEKHITAQLSGGAQVPGGAKLPLGYQAAVSVPFGSCGPSAQETFRSLPAVHGLGTVAGCEDKGAFAEPVQSWTPEELEEYKELREAAMATLLQDLSDEAEVVIEAATPEEYEELREAAMASLKGDSEIDGARPSDQI